MAAAVAEVSSFESLSYLLPFLSLLLSVTAVTRGTINLAVSVC